MKYKLLLALTLVSIGTILLDFKKEAHGNTAGAVAGVTGSPSDGNTCAATGCHTGSPVTAMAGWITSNIPGTGYIPGSSYTITATATQASLVKYGFQVSPQNAAGNLVGMMMAGAGTQVIGGGKYITHTSAGTVGTTGSHTWTFTWIAPMAGTGSFTFYGAFNCSNNNSMSSGDLIYTSTLAVTEAAPAALDCGIYSIITPVNFGCSTSVTPIVRLGNYGTTTLTSATISYFIDANTPSTFNWSGSLGTNSYINVTLPALTTTAGTHTFTAATSAPNSGTDLVTANDSKTSSFTTTTAGSVLPFTQGFDVATFPPTNWTAINPDNSTTWARSTTAHYSGTGSAYMDNYNYNAVGQRDGLVSPPVDLTSSTTPSLTFRVAYRPYTSGADTLMVLISTDCGLTWNSIYNKNGTTLATVSGTTGALFVPTAAQWRLETISLAAYHTCSTALLRFVNGNNYGNDIYIDDINVTAPTGIDELSNSATVKLFPNPINDKLTIEYSLTQTSPISIKMFDIQGREVADLVSEKAKSPGKYSSVFDMNEYKAGMYFITTTSGNSVSTDKVMIVH